MSSRERRQTCSVARAHAPPNERQCKLKVASLGSPPTPATKLIAATALRRLMRRRPTATRHHVDDALTDMSSMALNVTQSRNFASPLPNNRGPRARCALSAPRLDGEREAPPSNPGCTALAVAVTLGGASATITASKNKCCVSALGSLGERERERRLPSDAILEGLPMRGMRAYRREGCCA